MRTELDLFTLKHRIFLVKNFYQLNGDCMCVKTKYDSFYRSNSESPAFSSDVLVEIISLFERTGSVFRGPEAVTPVTLQGDCQQIEQVYVKVENPDDDMPAETEMGETFDYLESPVPENVVNQVNSQERYESDVYNSSGDNTSDTDTLSNEEYPLGTRFRGGKKRIPDWWENPDDSLETEDLTWGMATDEMEESQRSNNFDHFDCPDKNCRKTFKSWTAYNLHRLIHSDQKEKIHKCRNCDKIFLQKYALKRHFKRKHIPQQYKCYKCGCSFREEKNYRNHLEEHGQEPEYYDEPQNSPEFKKPEAPPPSKITKRIRKNKPVRRKPKPKPSTVMCVVCGKIMDVYYYKYHIKTHDKPTHEFKCHVLGCQRSYPNEKYLKRHLERHTNKKYKCDLCEAEYKDVQCLRKHIKKDHLKEEPPFKCEGCPKAFWTRTEVRAHAKSIHNIEMPLMREKRCKE